MPSRTPEHPSQLLSRLRADQAERWRRGEQAPVEDYLAQYPDLGDNPPALLELIRAEWLHRLECGDQPTLEDYVGRFPQLADDLRRGWLPASPSASYGPDSTGSDAPTRVAVARTSSDAAPLPGLELHEKLGSGGMGVVYRARDLSLDQPRAVKVIHNGPWAGTEARDRFQLEARAVARLDHEGVVRIYSFGEHGDMLYICMELLEGGSLQGRLRRGPLELRAAAELVQRLALAAQHAHDHQVLHRDLKPANVLLDSAGRPKVADFGLAKLLDGDDDLTRTGAIMGTPAYMAPEQAEGRLADVSARTDVWALGAILYECLTGQPPFRGPSRTETLTLVRTQPPMPPRRLRPRMPPDLEAICLKCLEKRPEDRYARAADLAADLQAWLDGKAPRVRSPGRPRRLLRALRRHPLRTASAVLVLLALLTAGLMRHFSNPDRPLWQEQQRLRRGEAVEVIGSSGKPGWSRWRMGEQHALTVVEADGVFVVEGWPLTLIQLLPDTCGHTRYRIHAEMRHLRGGQNGAIGLYFAGTAQGTGEKPVFSYLQVSYNDLFDDLDQYNRLPAAVRSQIPAPRGNRVQFMVRCVAEGEPPRVNAYCTFLEPQLFKPAGHPGQRGDWRTIRIDVSPSRVRITWDNQVGGERSPERLEKGFAGLLKAKPDNPALAGLVPALNLQGELGLYLYESSAAFRNVRVEPRTADDD